MCKCVGAYACACMCGLSVCVCVRVCVRARVHVWVESACGLSVCVCVYVYVRACVRVCMCVRYLVVLYMPLIIITIHTRSLLYGSRADGAISTYTFPSACSGEEHWTSVFDTHVPATTLLPNLDVIRMLGYTYFIIDSI